MDAEAPRVSHVSAPNGEITSQVGTRKGGDADLRARAVELILRNPDPEKCLKAAARTGCPPGATRLCVVEAQLRLLTYP